ncbi:hypothetical protein ACFRAE_13225 [Sphingobacterium sp. HJSM2_6]|uniref:hypothetical protein n=1 Tax=Sphingobacterium sp. HJSM2_6 TaxID=3366264 RepID=UPI003BDB32AD
MKNFVKLLGLMIMVALTFTACSKDDDPADNNLFVGRYDGDIGYIDFNNNENNVEYGDGSVTVAKVGNNYNFAFGNNIPNLNDIVMSKGENNSLFFTSEGIGSITITESTLEITYAKDGKTWRASCIRE